MRGYSEKQTCQDLHLQARVLACSYYLRTNFVPLKLRRILAATTSLKQLEKYNPDWASQPRVPSGNPNGGQWTGGGGRGGEILDSSTPKPSRQFLDSSGLRRTENQATEKRAKAIYGETSGLTPSLIDPRGNPYKESNWDKISIENLRQARAYIGIVSERNPRVHYAKPLNGSNSIQARAWGHSVDAAIYGSDSNLLDRHVTNFFLRQEGHGRQTPPWPRLTRILSLGPFNNVGGGDVPKGPNTYIDFYGKK